MITTELKSSIPFLDLVTPHLELEAQLVSVLNRTLATAGFIGGPMVEAFEQAYATYCDTNYCIGVNSGTDALRFALLAVGVEEGDAVITVCNTFIATTEAISQAGARPVFVDVNEDTGNIDPQKLQEFLESQCTVDAQGRLITRRQGLRVKAIVPVHLYGQPADMDPILELADRFQLEVIEDACQAHGAAYFSKRQGRWRKAGSMGHAAAFSFYPGKNLGACGEGGAVTTNDESLASKIRMLRDHGQEQKYYHRLEGYNGRLDALQAGFLSVKLPYLEQWNQQRRSAAQWYHDRFAEAADRVRVISELPNVSSVYHLYVICVSDRDRLREHLASLNIGTGIHYPVPLHLQEAYKELGYRCGDFPVTEHLASTIVSLPMFPQLQLEQQQRVADAILGLKVNS
jgi:dTDP-4-amino-4,6-dideoxygalactose transaminase